MARIDFLFCCLAAAAGTLGQLRAGSFAANRLKAAPSTDELAKVETLNQGYGYCTEGSVLRSRAAGSLALKLQRQLSCSWSSACQQAEVWRHASALDGPAFAPQKRALATTQPCTAVGHSNPLTVTPAKPQPATAVSQHKDSAEAEPLQVTGTVTTVLPPDQIYRQVSCTRLG